MVGVWVEVAALETIPGYYTRPGNEVTAWRISFLDRDSEVWNLTHRFARRRDAEAAIAALERAGFTLADLQNSPLGDDEEWPCEQIILEAMQW